MSIRKLLLVCVSVFVVSSSNLLAATQAPVVKITKVRTEKLDSIGHHFSTYINLQVEKSNINSWKLGCYWVKLLTPFEDPTFKMKIYNTVNPKDSAVLKYISSKKNNSLSAGYVSVIGPASPYTLKAGNSYEIALTNSNQWAPKVLSYMPQSFYMLYSDEAGKTEIMNIVTKPSAYIIGGYDAKEIAGQIAEHNKNNLINSSNLGHPIADKLDIVPTPVSIIETGGTFKIPKIITVYTSDKAVTNNAVLLVNSIFQNVKESNTVSKSVINFKKIENYKLIDNNPEGYQLTINKDGITVSAQYAPGFFYGIETLRNLIYTTKGNMPCLKITDYPRFKYRGIALDTCRHFFEISTIEKLIDVMAAQKINTLHLHLGDDEGWRLELKGMDFLIKGSTRGIAKGSDSPPARMVQANLTITNYKDFNPTNKMIKSHFAYANTLYKGYYTEKQIKALIKYANEREITIIPEIDFPGHSRALVYSAPNIFINKEDKSKYLSNQGYNDDVLPVCLYDKDTPQGKKFTKTINKIVEKVANLFSGQTTVYNNPNEVSVGGDEVSPLAWTNDPDATGEWKDLNALEKSIYFFRQLQKCTDVTMSGWQQFVQLNDGKIIKSIAVPGKKSGHVWVWDLNTNGIPNAIKLAKNGYPTVLAFANDTYFDLTYTPNKWEPGYNWAGSYLDTHAALRSAADSLKVINKLPEEYRKYILGVEGTLWSENIVNARHLFYKALPKMTGLSEAAWSPDSITVSKNYKIDWKSLTGRLGTDQSGFLGYLSNTFNVKYRGYPNGISKEL